VFVLGKASSFHTPDLPSRSARHTPGGGVVVAGRPPFGMSWFSAARIGNLLATGGRRFLQERGCVWRRTTAGHPPVSTGSDGDRQSYAKLPATAAGAPKRGGAVGVSRPATTALPTFWALQPGLGHFSQKRVVGSGNRFRAAT